jgi:thioesterase domain-containing protein/acyl carrier protein
MLAELWEEMIDVRPIGIEDDFFELGGDSLLAVSLLTRIEESLGRAVPQAKFMERPTIDGLSRALIEEDAKRAQPMLVKLLTGGKGCPLMYVHGDFNGGGYYCYRLAQHFNGERPLWLLHPHGLFTPELPVTIEAMAADNVQTLLAEWDGPFVLGGHCNGGLVALEMAQQLHARGSRVDAVIMIAPPKLEQPSSNGGGRLEPATALAARRFEMGRVAQATRREFLVRAYGRIVNAYRPTPYEGKLTVLQPAESGPLPEVWQQMARDVEIRTIAGGHLTSITQYVAQVAAELNTCVTNGR